LTGKLIVFDLDGTLIDSASDLATALNLALRHFSPQAPLLGSDTVRSFIGNGAGVLLGRSLAFLGLSVTVEEALPVFLRCYKEHLLDTTRLFPGVSEALRELGREVLCVLTNKPGDLSREILRGLGVAQHFRAIYGGGDLPSKKPDPQGLLLLMKETGKTPAQTWMVGDSVTDIRTGRAAGALTVGVTYGFDRPGLEREPPDLLLDDLQDLLPALTARP